MPRPFQNPLKVPPKVYGELKVKNKVLSGASEKLTGICLSEMQQVFSCFKKFAFNEEACAKEITAFQGCYDRHVTSYKNKSGPQSSGKAAAAEVTKLLRKYPERKKDLYS